MTVSNDEVKSVVREACQKACGVTKLTTVTLHVDHLKQAVGDAAGDKLANGGTGNVAVCPRAVLLAMGEKKPPAKSAGK